MKKKCCLFIALLLTFTHSFAQLTDAEFPAISLKNHDAFFIPSRIIQKYKLEASKSDDWMKVYNKKNTKTFIQRVNDIRWQAKDQLAALAWYTANGKLLNENARDISEKLLKPAGVAAWNIYEASDEMKKLMESMDIKQNQYTFTFVVDKYVAKIFVGTDNDKTVSDAWIFAKEGLKATLKAAGKPKQAALVL